MKHIEVDMYKRDMKCTDQSGRKREVIKLC